MLRVFKYLVVVGALGLLTNSLAQTASFSQFYSNPINSNPAFTGSDKYAFIRLSTINRLQWSQLAAPYYTSLVSVDAYLRKINGGIGFTILYDNQGGGALRATEYGLSYAHHHRISRDVIVSLGAQASYYQLLLDPSVLVFEDQLDARFGITRNTTFESFSNTTLSKFNFSSGFLIQAKKWFLGSSVLGLGNRDQNFLQGENENGGLLPPLFSVQTGLFLPVNRYLKDKTILSPNVQWRRQGNFQQLSIGFYYSTKEYVLGTWYRSDEAIVLLAGVKTEYFKIGYSYDLGIGRFGFVAGGSHEISLGYQFDHPPHRRKPSRNYKRPVCPKFYKELL